MPCLENLLLILQLVTLLAETACFCFSLSSLLSISILWFAICTSFLCVTSVVTQFLSLWWTQADISHCKYGILVLLHLLFFGLPVRYVIAGIRGLRHPQLYATIFKHTGLLRLIYTSLCTVPFTISIFFVFWYSGRIHWIYFASSIVGVLSAATSLSVLRRPSVRISVQKDKINCSAIVLSFIWRFGEIVSRVLVLVLFASMYSYWVLLVIGLHWFTMFAWASIFSCYKGQQCNPAHVLHIGSVSYVNTFAFLDSTKFQPKYGRLLYYFIMSVENATLVIVCLIYSWQQTLNVLISMVATGAYVASLIAAGIHRLCIKQDVQKPEESERNPPDGESLKNPKTSPANSIPVHKRPAHPPKYSDINNSVTTSMETLNTQVTRSSYVDRTYPAFIGEAPPAVPLAASHFHSVSDPDLSLKRKRNACKRTASQRDSYDVIRLIMRESGSNVISDNDPNMASVSYVTPSSNGKYTKPTAMAKGQKVTSPLSESDSEYALDQNEFSYSPDEIVQLDPRLLDAPIVFYKKPKFKSDRSSDAPPSGQDSDYGTLKQWVKQSKPAPHTHRNPKKREVQKKRPSIVCGTGFHKQRQGILYAKDALGWRKSESDISKSSKTTALSAPSEFMIINTPHGGKQIANQAVSVASSQTHHSDPLPLPYHHRSDSLNSGGVGHPAARSGVPQSPRSPVPHGDVTSDSCLSVPPWSSQDDICSLYSTDISSHTTADELKAAISEKYRIKTRSAKRNTRRKSYKTPDSIQEERISNSKPSKQKQFEAEIDSIVSAIKSEKKHQRQKPSSSFQKSSSSFQKPSSSFHAYQKSYTSDYGSLQDPELSLHTLIHSKESET